MGGQCIGGCPFRVVLYRYHLWDNIPGLPHHDGISDIHPQLGDKILIMQGGSAHSGTRQLYRVKFRGRRHCASASHLQHHIPQYCLLFLRRVLKGHCPFGVFGRTAQKLSICKAVHLYNRAVDLVSQRSA